MKFALSLVLPLVHALPGDGKIGATVYAGNQDLSIDQTWMLIICPKASKIGQALEDGDQIPTDSNDNIKYEVRLVGLSGRSDESKAITALRGGPAAQDSPPHGMQHLWKLLDATKPGDAFGNSWNEMANRDIATKLCEEESAAVSDAKGLQLQQSIEATSVGWFKSELVKFIAACQARDAAHFKVDGTIKAAATLGADDDTWGERCGGTDPVPLVLGIFSREKDGTTACTHVGPGGQVVLPKIELGGAVGDKVTFGDDETVTCDGGFVNTRSSFLGLGEHAHAQIDVDQDAVAVAFPGI